MNLTKEFSFGIMSMNRMVGGIVICWIILCLRVDISER